ncbi:MAG: hypothetical protein JXR96_23940 [Deltaproteobacteria bacterium]|nr:hypothetical protein [Deltaproteobacteria bacterium]
MLRSISWLVWLVAVVFIPLEGMAGSPPYVPLQGVLEDSAGAPVDGTREIVFSIYGAQTGGAALWTETQTVLVDDGLFTVYLGQNAGLDLALFRDHDDLWLGVQVGSDSEMPRLYLGSVPFSGYARYSPSDLLSSLSCTGDQVAKWNGSAWVCADDEDTDTLGGMRCAAGQVAKWNGSGWICAADESSGTGGDTLAELSCASGQLARWDGSDWVCAQDADALGELFCLPGQVAEHDGAEWGCAEDDDTTYSAGFGLALSGTEFSADSAQVQSRVSGDCVPFGAIQAIGQDGSVVCQGVPATDALRFDSGWTAYPFRFADYFDHGLTGELFVFSMVRGYCENGGRLSSPAMQASDLNTVPAYVALSGGRVGLNGHSILIQIANLGARNNLQLLGGDVRVRVFDRSPDYDSGWKTCDRNTTYTEDHGLGSFPHFTLLELAESGDGSGWRVPVMSSSNYDGAWRQTAVVGLDASQAVIRTAGSLAHFHDIAGNNQAPSAGFYRLRLYDWTPDFDSGWVSISTAAGDQDKRFRHGFGREPSLVMLYVAESSGGSGWCLPAMGNWHNTYNDGVGFYSIDEMYAVIKGGAGRLAQFLNSAGNGTNPSAGYVRFLAWR